MVEEYGYKIVLFSFIFLLIILFFAFELPFFQHILKLNNFMIAVLLSSIVATYLLSWKASKREDTKGQIVFISTSLFIIIMFISSTVSFINRSFPLGQSTKINVNSIQLEYSSMFGMMDEEKKNIKPTHLRLQFDHNEAQYNRAFSVKKIELSRNDEEEVMINLKKGLLSFWFVGT